MYICTCNLLVYRQKMQQMLLQIHLFLILCYTLSGVSETSAHLKVGFYKDSCPKVESIVAEFVRNASLSNPRMTAILLRLHFHDCFVQGCDGSILIEGGPKVERQAFGHQGLGGFQVIESAKAKLEKLCPGVVSCADIVAIAARDAVTLANGPLYNVETGRRDGTISDVSLAKNMPDVTDSIAQLKAKFSDKGLSDKDLVLLSAAHTIGTTACFFMTGRLYNFFNDGGSDPSINNKLLPKLRKTCPQDGDVNVRLGMDSGSEQRFDIQILHNIRRGFAVLQSDAVLYADESTRTIIDSYFATNSSDPPPSFSSDFVNSIVKMGRIDVKTGHRGTIRRVCGDFN